VNDTPISSPFLAKQRAARVLVFCVDDALFCLHVDWVEAVYPQTAVRVHALRTRAGQAQRFLAHSATPALVIDLREVFGVPSLRAVPERAHYLIVRSGSITLAVAADACLGVRSLDLHAQTPVPSAIVRDGGFPVAHLLSLDGKMLAVLDPSHLLDSAARSLLGAMQPRAEGFLARQTKLEALWAEIRTQPTETNLRNFARLCARNGRGRTAAATRLVLKHLTGPNGDGDAASEPERLIGRLVQLSRERRTGELLLAPAAAAHAHKFVFADGRIVNARADAVRGKAAVDRLLAAHSSDYHFIDMEHATEIGQIDESTAALAIASLETLASRTWKPAASQRGAVYKNDSGPTPVS